MLRKLPTTVFLPPFICENNYQLFLIKLILKNIIQMHLYYNRYNLINFRKNNPKYIFRNTKIKMFQFSASQ